jgi:molybdopterin-guanine dinucleotide biosynthesis protein A
MTIGGVLLCGGKSTRMGRSKALLPFRGRTMVEQVLATLHQVVGPVVVVAAVGQELPLLDRVLLQRDERPERGPLEAIRVGLESLPATCHAAYVTSCDVPLLRPEFIHYVIDQLADYDAVVPFEGKFAHPLAAVYRTSVVPIIDELIEADQWRPRFLIDRINSCHIDVEQLRAVDPDLESLMNINHPEDYEGL